MLLGAWHVQGFLGVQRHALLPTAKSVPAIFAVFARHPHTLSRPLCEAMAVHQWQKASFACAQAGREQLQKPVR